MLTVVAIALLGGAAGARASAPRWSSAALLVALPLTLALQWALRSRYLGRPDGLAHLARRRLLLALRRARPRRRARRRARAERGRRRRCSRSPGRRGTLLIAPPLGGRLRRRRDRRATAAMLAGVPAAGRCSPCTAAPTTRGGRRRACACRGGDIRPTRPAGRAGVRSPRADRRRARRAARRRPERDWTVGAVPALALLPSTVAALLGRLPPVELPAGRSRARWPACRWRARHARSPAWPGLRVLFGAVGRLVGRDRGALRGC